MNLAVLIDDALLRIVAHASRAHMMPPAACVVRPLGVVIAKVDLKPAKIGRANLGAKNFERSTNALFVEWAQLPVELGARLAKLIACAAQYDAAVGVGHWVDTRANPD